MRRIALYGFQFVLLVGVLAIGTVPPSNAQDPVEGGEGTATLEEWPRSLPNLLDEMGRKAPYLLPRIDSLALDYRYAVTDTTSRWSFVLSWRPAERVLYEGKVRPLSEGPQGIRMTNVELRADVRVDGEKRAEIIVAVDSMGLRPTPDRFAFNVTVSHDRVFLDTSPEEARRILRQEATLGRLVVERMGFSAAGTSSRRDNTPDARERRQEPSRAPSIYTPRTNIYIGWRLAPRPYYVGGDRGDDRRTRRPRGKTVGRTPTADAGREQGDDSNTSQGRGRDEGDEGEDDGGKESTIGDVLSGEDGDEDEEDDDTSLQTPALATAAAVGLIAFAGGTVGLYGQGDTPIGLASGYTHPNGGVQLQAAVNQAVLEDGPDQKLSVKALGFYDVFDARVQPAVGLGIRVDPSAGRDVDPDVSGGLVGNLGRFVLYGGVDVVQGTPEFGISYNFRYGGKEKEE